MIKKLIVIFLCVVLFFSFTVSSEKLQADILYQIEKSDVSMSDDVPIWQIGHNWKYYIEYEGEIGSSLSYNLAFENIVFTVTGDTGTQYLLTISGDVTGEMTISSIQLIKGQLKETTLTGTCSVDKSNIGLKELDAHMQGKISVANIPIKSFTIDIDVTFTPSYSSVSFPINVGKNWVVPLSNVQGTLTLSLLQNPSIIADVVGGNNAKCTGTEAKTVTAGTFDAYKITSDGDVQEWYYAPDAGNVIKAFGDVSNRVDITLLSTNYDASTPGAPNKPSKPAGPSSGKPGTKCTYSTSTIDSEGDQIYYWFDWGDGSNSGWLGPYNSGDTCESSKTWSGKGTFSVKVKAKDIEGHQSSWSDPLSVSMPKSKTIDVYNCLYTFKDILSQRFSMLYKIFYKNL